MEFLSKGLQPVSHRPHLFSSPKQRAVNQHFMISCNSRRTTFSGELKSGTEACFLCVSSVRVYVMIENSQKLFQKEKRQQQQH